MKPLCIVNPQAGGGRTGRTFETWRRTVEGALGAVEFVFTESKGDGARLAREGALAGATRILAFGGDGTVNEIANGIVESGQRPTLGIVAQGTGGDFRRTLGLEHRLDRYLDTIRAGRSRAVDVGRAHYSNHQGVMESRVFVNILSAGMGGLVDQYVANASRSLGATVAYFGATVRALTQVRTGHLFLRGEGPDGLIETELSSLIFAVCNGRYFGSGMKMAPHAELDDGVFEVVSMDSSSKLGFAVVNAPSIYAGKHLRNAKVLRVSKLEVLMRNAEDRNAFLLDVDGEALGTLPLSLQVEPRALDVFCP